jgi:hypothetical protein
VVSAVRVDSMSAHYSDARLAGSAGDEAKVWSMLSAAVVALAPVAAIIAAIAAAAARIPAAVPVRVRSRRGSRMVG